MVCQPIDISPLNLLDVDETAAPDGRVHSSMIFLLWIPFTRRQLNSSEGRQLN